MKKKNLAFGDAEIEKWKLHYFNIWIPNRSKWIIICSKFSFGKKGFKYFVGCKDDGKVGALYIKLPQMSGHAKRFDKTRHDSSN